MNDPISLKLVFSLLAGFLFLIYWVFNFVILYHLVRFGIGVQPKILAAAFLLGMIVLSFLTALFFVNFDLNFPNIEWRNLGQIILNIIYKK